MGKKKPFINKKNSATFHLLARDTSASDVAAGAPESDRVFVRVDNNPYSVRGLEDDDEGDEGEVNEEFGQDSIFADAPEGADDVRDWISGGGGGGGGHGESRGVLPAHVRRDIIELGFPDDGYNYLLHLREIKNAGGGSTYYHNSKAKLDQLPLDVKV